MVYKNSVRTSQETHYVSATKPNRLMLFTETVAVYCENHTEHTDPVRAAQKTHYVSATKPNRLMLFRETVAVYCENQTEHTNTLSGQNVETLCIRIQFVPHRKRITFFTTKPNRLMLFRETVVVYCENHTEHTNTLCGQNAEYF
jgi:predicted Zn-dependent protease with MMP-like domain